MSQKKRDYIIGLLATHAIPAGSILTIHKGNEGNFKIEPRDEVFQPESAVVHLIPKGGGWMDGQCYDKEGYKVYND